MTVTTSFIQNMIIPADAKNYVPAIELLSISGVCSISGEACSGKTLDLLDEVICWVDSYFHNGKNAIVFNFDLDYFSSEVSRGIARLLSQLKDYQTEGKDVSIRWVYEDEDNLEYGEDLMKEVGVGMRFIEK